MKYITTLLLMATCITISNAQKKGKDNLEIPIDSATNKYSYVQIVEVSDKSSEELYQLAKKWCIHQYSLETFLVDKSNDQLTQSGSFVMNTPALGALMIVYTVTYNVTFRFKEGKSRIQVTDIKISQASNGGTVQETMESFEQRLLKLSAKAHIRNAFTEIDTNIKTLQRHIEVALKGNGNESDW